MIPLELAIVDDNGTLTSSTYSISSSPTTNSVTTPTSMHKNVTLAPVMEHPCQWILYVEINNSGVHAWDVMILVPNVLFLLFLLLSISGAIKKLRRNSSPIFLAFYGLIFSVVAIGILRCLVSMTVNATMPAGDIADRVLWLILRFFLLATELSVIIFGFAFGHLDSKTSIRWVLVITFTIALLYSGIQGTLEFLRPDNNFHVVVGDSQYDIFSHGGMLFWLISSSFFCLVYFIICILPFTKINQHFPLPHKKSFYVYCVILSILNLVQSIGSGMLYHDILDGMCLVDVTSYLYFAFFALLVYVTFLWKFFMSTPMSNLMFSYKHQTDEEEDSVSLPHQLYDTPSSLDQGEGRLSMGTGGDSDLACSADFDPTSPNPLYDTGLHLGNRSQLYIDYNYFIEGAGTAPNSVVGNGHVSIN